MSNCFNVLKCKYMLKCIKKLLKISFFISVPLSECLGLPWGSESALLSGWLDLRKCHAFIHRGPISERRGDDPELCSPKCLAIRVPSADDRAGAASICAGLVRLAGAEYGRAV